MSIASPNPEKAIGERFGNEGGADSNSAPPDVPKRKRGRPKGSKNKIDSNKQIEPEVKQRTKEEEIAGAKICGFLSATIWSIVAPFANKRDLSDEEALKLGEALDPVLYKYMPFLDDWKLELNLLLVIATLWTVTDKGSIDETIEIPPSNN